MSDATPRRSKRLSVTVNQQDAVRPIPRRSCVRSQATDDSQASTSTSSLRRPSIGTPAGAKPRKRQSCRATPKRPETGDATVDTILLQRMTVTEEMETDAATNVVQSATPKTTKTVQAPTPRPPSHTSELSDTSSDESTCLIGRVNERNRLRQLVQDAIDDKRSMNIYICGAPGTGKTAVVHNELTRIQSLDPVGRKLYVVNCMQITSAASVYRYLLDIVAGRDAKPGQSEAAIAADIEQTLVSQGRNAVTMLVFDEIDQLATRQQDVLYRIFDWPAKLSCQVVLIGIANALDLPDRLLPRLSAQLHRPVRITFTPYTHAELAAIVELHLSLVLTKAANLDPAAVHLCARKVAAQSGDARTAVNVCRRAIDLARLEQKITPSQPMLVRPTLRHISNALNTSQYLSPRPVTVDNENRPPGSSAPTRHPVYPFDDSAAQPDPHSDLPLHHRIVVACFQLARNNPAPGPRSVSHRELPFPRLYEIYASVCRQCRFAGLNEGELAAVCDSLEARGLIEPARPAKPSARIIRPAARMRSLRLRLDADAVKRLIGADSILRTISEGRLP